MSRAFAVIRYDGPALADHKMDVEQIAPAMLALAELIKRANSMANGDRASVKVLMNADVDQHCFELVIEIVQTLYDQAVDLISRDDVKSAKDIAEWLGIIAGTTIGAGTTAVGLLKLIKFLQGRRPDEVKMVVQDGVNVTQIMAGGDVILAHPQAYDLYKDPQSVRNVKSMTRPLSEEGYNTLDFEGEDGAVAETFDREDARAIQEMPEPLAPVATRLPVSHTTAWVRIRKAVYDGPGKWTIQYDKSRDVTIADAEWLEKFQSNHVSAPPGSLLQVYMRVSEIELDKSGRPVKEPEYTILQVLDVRTPEQLGGQPSLFDEP